MKNDWEYQDEEEVDTIYQFASVEPKKNLQKWIKIGVNYDHVGLGENLEQILKSFSNDTGTSIEGLTGYMSRIENNLKLIEMTYDSNLFKNIVDIGPGWGPLRLYAEALDIAHYYGIDPIEATREIFQETNKSIELRGSKTSVTYIKKVDKFEGLRGNTLFYAANVLSELSDIHMGNYLNFIADNLKNNDYLIIEDWYRRDRRHKLVAVMLDKFYCEKIQINFKNYHIITLLTNRSHSNSKIFFCRVKIYFHIYFVFAFLKVIRKIKKDGVIQFAASAMRVIRHKKSW